MDAPSYRDAPERPRPSLPPHTTEQPAVIDPRRKYKRRTTDSLSENKESGSENESGSMSGSEEHELGPIGSDVDVDEETGLTGPERKKHVQRKRQRDALDARIGGAAASKHVEREADKDVIRKLVVNSGLIGLWYLFSLSISIVRTAVENVAVSANKHAVQQMDVLKRTPRFPFPTIYDLPPYGGAVPTRFTGTPHIPVSATCTASAGCWPCCESASTSNVLSHSACSYGDHNLSRHWFGQYLITIHHSYILHHV